MPIPIPIPTPTPNQANYLHVLALLTRLRQACDSPQLVQQACEDAEQAEAA